MGDMMKLLVATVCLLASLTNAFQEVSSPEYIARTAAEKSEIIWSNVLEDLTPADWGDKHLFFRHQDMAEDVALMPEWEEYLDKFGIPGDSGCPVMRMMNRRGRLADNM